MLVKRDGFIPRHAEKYINNAMNHEKMLAVSGAPGCGKSTLAKKIAEERGMEYVSLNDPITYKQARRDPKGFLENLAITGGVIDEIQKDLRLAKFLRGYLNVVPTPGRFMVTSPIRTLVRPSFYFGGEATRLELGTLFQSEIEGSSSPCSFLVDALEGKISPDDPCGRLVDLWPRILRGSYPRAVLAESIEESMTWLKSYKNRLKNSFMKETFMIRSHDKFKKFLLYLAENSGGWFCKSTIARKLNVKVKTLSHWMLCLHNADIITWVHNHTMSEFRSSDPRRGYKVHFLDSGLLASLRGWSNLDSIFDSAKRQSLLASFVHGELRKSMGVGSGLLGLSTLNCYETNSGAKVDFVLNAGPGVVGVVVKASSALKSSDFEGLRSLKKEMEEYEDVCGGQLTSGVVFHAGEEIYCTDEGFYGLPVGMLWAPSQVKAEKIPAYSEEVVMA